MKALLLPATLLLNQLGYPRKLALIGLIFLLPFFFSGYLLLSGINADIAFAKRELAGFQSLKPLKNLLRAAQEHRGIAQFALNGDPAAPQRLEALGRQIDTEIQALDAFDAQFGKALNSTEEWKQVKMRWDSLRAKAIDIGAEDSFSLHTAFIECVQAFLLHVSDASGLSLDPALNTHHLIAAVTVKLAQLTESLGQTRALSANASREQTLSPRDHHRLTEVVNNSQRIRAGLLGGLKTAFALTPELHARMGGPLQDAVQTTDALLSSTENLLQNDTIKPGAQEIFQRGTRAIDAVYHLSDISLPWLEQSIHAHTETLALKKWLLLALDAATLLFAAYLFTAFTVTLIRQMNALRQGAKDVVEGNLNTRIVLDSHDEMALIAYFFNGMVDSLRYQFGKVRRSEAELRLSEEKYRALMDQANDAMLVADLDGKLLDANRSAEKMLGYGKEEILQLHALDLHPEEEKARVVEAFRTVRENGFSEEYLVRRKDGTVISVNISSARATFDSGDLVIGIFHDISERKRTEEQLRLAATVFEGTAEGIMITDATGTIVSVNPAFTRLTGYAPQDSVGKTPAILKSGRHDQAFYHDMWNQALAHESWQGEVWDRRKDGAIFPAWLTISAVRGKDGAPRYFVGIFSDISLMKESQRHIEYLANFDALTGLPNRNLFHDRLKHAIARVARQGDGFALMFIDLDNFKAVNDALGHDAGDLLLQEAARRLEKCIRDGDTAARLGGDEFTVLLETSDGAAVARTAQRIVEVLAETFFLQGSELHVTCSIGISMHPEDGEDDQTLMKNADMAMYRAKQRGKNSFQFFGD